MTGKRFTITQDFEEHHRQIRDNGKIIMGCFLEPQAEPIVNLLNELHEEKEIAIEGIQIANDLIMKYGSEELKHEWQKNVRVKEYD